MKLIPGIGLNGSTPASPASELPAAKALGKTAALGASGFLAVIRAEKPMARHPDGTSNASLMATAAAKPSTQAAPETSANVGQGVRWERPAALNENGVRVSPQRAEVRGDAAGRRMEEGVSAASAGIDWPWLAIATGGLSYRTASSSSAAPVPTAASTGRSEPVRYGASASAGAVLHRSAISDAAPSTGPAPSIVAVKSSADGRIAAAQDLDSTQGAADVSRWSWPAEVRELIERRRLQIVDEGGGTVRLLARDFHLDPVAMDRWAASIHRELQAAGQFIRVLWINGRHYDFPQGESHDR